MEAFDNQYLLNLKNLSIEELYFPNFLHFIRILTATTFTISGILFIITIYIVIKKSTKAMGSFKYVLLCQLSCNMCVQLINCFTNFFVFFPIPLMSANSLLPIKKEWFLGLAMALLFFGICFISIFIWASGARVLAILSGDSIFVIVKKWIKVAVILCTIFAWITISVPVLLMIENPAETQSIFESHIPALKDVFRIMPESMGLILNSKSAVLGPILAAICSFWLAGGALTILAFNFIFLWRMKKIKKRISKETYAVQKMLYRCLLIQFLNSGMLFFLPTIFAEIIFILQLHNVGFIGCLPLPILTFHPIVDCLCLLYFVKPYKNFIKSFISKEKTKLFEISGWTL